MRSKNSTVAWLYPINQIFVMQCEIANVENRLSHICGGTCTRIPLVARKNRIHKLVHPLGRGTRQFGIFESAYLPWNHYGIDRCPGRGNAP